jgi:hypothetical protein
MSNNSSSVPHKAAINSSTFPQVDRTTEVCFTITANNISGAAAL